MLREFCPCDIDGVCPYGAESWGSCEWWCGEPDATPENWTEESEVYYNDD